MALYKLSAKQLRLLGVLVNPEHWPKTMLEKAKLAGCRESYIFLCRKNPVFIEAQESIRNEILTDGVIPVIDKLRDKARKGNVQAIRLYLEVAGIYNPRVEHTGKDGEPIDHSVNVIYTAVPRPEEEVPKEEGEETDSE